MAKDIPARASKAAAVAAAVNNSIYKGSNTKAEIQGIAFRLVLLSALGVALIMIFSIVAWAVVEGGARVNPGLFLNNPSSFRPEQAGYRPAILGTVQLITGVIVVIVPLGIGAATYLELFADRTRWYNRVVELNIQNLAGVPSIVFGILGLAFIVRGFLDLGFVVAAGSATIAILVLPTVIWPPERRSGLFPHPCLTALWR
jgi:phosphate transport system permease protein